MRFTKKHPFKKYRLGFVIGGMLIIVGLLIGGYNLFAVWRSGHRSIKLTTNTSVLMNNEPAKSSLPKIKGTPSSISIPSLNIALNVIPGYYYPDTKSWTLSLDKAQFAVMTAQPNNQKGLTFIYAHARKGIFYNLPSIKANDTAVVKTKNGRTFTYKFETSIITTPDNTSLFEYKGAPVLVLQTCTGLWYQDRQLFVFKFSKVS